MYTKNPEYFLTVAREGSISRAAEKLYLSQPYLSQCIGRLEQELQMKLFDRSHTPLVLTDAGRLYLSYLEGVGNLTGKFESQIEELRTGSRQILNVGMTPWRGSVLLPDILPAYAAAHPDVRIVLHEYHSNTLAGLVREDKIDFALMNIPNKIDGFVYQIVFYERMFLVANKIHPAAAGIETSYENPAYINLQELKKERFILLPNEHVMGQATENLFARMNMLNCDILYTTSSTTAVNLVSEGFGLPFMPEGGIRQVPHLNRLAFFTVDHPPFCVPLLILYKKNAFITPQAQDFIEMTKQYYARLKQKASY